MIAELKGARDAAVAATIGPVALALIVYYPLITAAHLLVLPDPIRQPMAALAASSAVICAVTAALARWRSSVIAGAPHAWALSVGTLVAVNSIIHMALEGNALQTTNLLLVVLACGLFYRSWPALVFTVALSWAGFAWAASLSAAQPWAHFGFALFATTLVSVAIHHIRGRSFREVVRLRALEGQQRDALAWAAREAHRSEARYRTLVALSPDPVIALASGRVVFANHAAADMLKTTEEQLAGSEMVQWMTVPQASVVMGWSRGEQVHNIQVQPTTGALVPVEAHTAAVQLDGEPAVLVVLRDKRAREAAIAVKNEFVASVSHELRTPLTSISGALRLLKTNPKNDMGPWALDMVALAERNSARLASLVENLLDLQRLDQDATPIAKSPVILSTVLEPLANAANRTVTLSGDVDVEVSGDAQRLRTLFRTLIDNAVKFSPADAPVYVRVTALVRKAQVHVEDSGPGIPEQHRQDIFVPFRQLDTGSTKTYDGAGIGLTIARGIVEAHGGNIAVTDRPGGGSRFSVELPIAVTESRTVPPLVAVDTSGG